MPGVDVALQTDMGDFAGLARELSGCIAGGVRTDALARVLYATDASIYEIVPDGVVLPKSAADVVATVKLCAKYGVPLTARGAGTGLSGGCVNRGIQLDCSQYLNRVLEIDPQTRTARVEPGVVLDELNAALTPHGLQFPPDVATSSRATIGGMIANNSAGAHSIIYGRTCDHVLSVDVVLADGSVVTWGRSRQPSAVSRQPEKTLAAQCEAVVAEVLEEHADEIVARFPKVMRSNGGYALDRLRRGAARRLNVEQLICGSEGTLGVIVGATLKLVPLPKQKGLVVVHFDTLAKALNAVPDMLAHQPAAVELLDGYILVATKDNPAMLRRRWFLDGDPAAILIVEFYDEEAAQVKRRLDALVDDLRARRIGYAWPLVTDVRQADVWEVRKGGTGLLMSRPGETQPYDFVDDTAVDPARLGDYMVRFGEILKQEGIELAGYYGHASVGLLHVRPALNLRKKEDIARLRRIGDRVSSLVAEFGGAMTGEHGDGIVRSCWLEKTYGPRLVAAFKRIKRTFDPQGIFNPGKIVDPLPMDGPLRYGGGFEAQQPATLLDFSPHAGMAGMAQKCEGLGQCRQRLVGTMCPSYMATGDEAHTTRARANALRVALSNKGLLQGLSDPALDEVMDLCLSCKACKTECPTGVDMARLKAEWLHHRNERLGVPRRSRIIAASVGMAKWGRLFAPLSNWVMQARPTRVILEYLYGLDRRVPPPRFARTTFRQWFAFRPPTLPAKATFPWPRVVYFVDTWTNYYTPQVGQAVVRVLDALGYDAIIPPTVCCGRPLISKGLLREAKELAEKNVRILAPYAERGIPIVSTEPSCVSAMLDEWPQLVRTPAARRVAECAMMIEAFVAGELRKNPAALRFRVGCVPDAPSSGGKQPGASGTHPTALNASGMSSTVLYHGHCHQKALTGTADAVAVLAACTGGRASEINSGCCGMAGAFGHEVEHYEVARAIGEQRLFPAIRDRGEAAIAVSGFSCRHHIAHHTGVAARHVIELIADALIFT